MWPGGHIGANCENDITCTHRRPPSERGLGGPDPRGAHTVISPPKTYADASVC